MASVRPIGEGGCARGPLVLAIPLSGSLSGSVPFAVSQCSAVLCCGGPFPDGLLEL